MKMSLVSVFLMVLCFGAEVHATSPWCEVLLSPEKVTRPGTDDTQGLIGYLGALLGNQIIGSAELSRLESGLAQGTLVNPISEQDAQVSARLLIHHEGLQELVNRNQVDSAQLLDWVRLQLGERERVHVHREEARDETQEMFRKMEFHRVDPGTFQMGVWGEFIEVTLTEPFDLMSTKVTQRHWSKVMGNNPSYFKDGDQSLVMMIQGNAIRMQPDHPVEQVSWDDIQEFIQKLNALSLAGDPLLFQLIPDHKKGDQYRLPTEAEWEFVVKERGRDSARSNFGNRREGLDKLGWFAHNSGGTTHPVAELEPLMVDNMPFYDFYGNVLEWVQDFYGFPNGKRLLNPRGPKRGRYRLYRGSDWDTQLGGWFRGNALPGERRNSMGFRLARIPRVIRSDP